MDKSYPTKTPMVVRSLDVEKDPFRPREEEEEILGPHVPYLSAIGAIIIICYIFLLIFPLGFKEFLMAYLPVFFLVFILHEFLEEQYHSLISRTDSIKGGVSQISFNG